MIFVDYLYNKTTSRLSKPHLLPYICAQDAEHADGPLMMENYIAEID